MRTFIERTQLGRWLPAALIGMLLLTTGVAPAEDPAKSLPTKADFHVASDGKDSNPGTAAAPFATLAQARDAVRAKVAAGLTGDVLVLIHAGVYPQTESLTFGPDDSGSEKYSITYAAAPDETVVLSGGQKIAGWTKGAGEIWTTEIPEATAGKWYFRQLFVNGNRALRARTPNVDDKAPWWLIKSCNYNKDNPAPPDAPVVLSLTGRIADYGNPADIEFVYTCNNDMGRKCLASVSAADQTLTLATPNRWNPQLFKFDWYLSIPTAGAQGQFANQCYLENSLEMLDQPGEWYLDRKSGVLSYWPRSGEDLTTAKVIAPVAQNTMLAFIGTPDRPLRNVHVRGIRCEYIDWLPPAWGYMGLFCCNVAIHRQPDPGHRFIDAAVEYSHARSCSFRDGGVNHVGAMGVCLREGTSQITIEGNEIADLGGGGIGLGGCNVAAGYTNAAPPPRPGEFQGYRIANNHVHHCGADYYGAVGIAVFLTQDSVIAHNLIHDTAYFGLCVAGSQAGSTPFAGSNRIEYNHIHDAMKVTVDGAGMYITFAHTGSGTLVRGNVVHDTAPGKGRVPSAGIYLDCDCSGCRFEQNLVYRNNAAGPLIFNYADARTKNGWFDNTMEKGGLPPTEFLDAVQAFAGPEPAYLAKLFKNDKKQCEFRALGETGDAAASAAYQYHLPRENRGVVQIIRHGSDRDEKLRLKLPGVVPADHYRLKVITGTVADVNVWGPGAMPMLTTVGPADGIPLGVPAEAFGRDLQEAGLTVNLPEKIQMMWIIYGK